MGLAEEVARFADEIRQGVGDIKTEITVLPSGAVLLRTRVVGRVFDLDYYPSLDLFGVDELEADMGFNTGHKFNFKDFKSAKSKLQSLLKDAQDSVGSQRANNQQ